MHRRTTPLWKSRLIISLISSLILGFAVSPIASATTTSAPLNSPANPSGTFTGSSGVDTWNAVSDGTHVYGMAHVPVTDTTTVPTKYDIEITCNVIADGSTCANFPMKSPNYVRATMPTLIYQSGYLYSFVETSTASRGDYGPGSMGLLKMNLSATTFDQVTSAGHFFDSYTPLYSNSTIGVQILGSSTYLVGTKIYGYALLNGSSSGLTNQLLCFDLSGTGCGPSQNMQRSGSDPFGGLASSGATDSSSAILVTPWIAGNRMYVPWDQGTKIACVDLTTNSQCAGWSGPIVAPSSAAFRVVMNASGTPTGFCTINSSSTTWSCFNNSGASISTPANFASVFPGIGYFNSTATTTLSVGGVQVGQPLNFPASMMDQPVVVGTREYAIVMSTNIKYNIWNGIGYSTYIVQVGKANCYDFATNAICANFPSALYDTTNVFTSDSVTVSSYPSMSITTGNVMVWPYSLTQDPASPSCLWANGDRGTWQIRTVDAYSGGACGAGGTRILASTYSGISCSASSYSSFALTDSANTWDHATVQFTDNAGTNVGSAFNLTASGSTGTATLSGLPDTATQLLVNVYNGSTLLNDPISTTLTCGSGLAPSNYTVTTATAGSGTGTVTSSPTVTAGSSVTLVATATGGSTFNGWSCSPIGGTSSNASFTFTPSADTTCTASFLAAGTPSYTVTTATAGSGTGTVSGGGSVTGSTNLVATPTGGSTFAGWSCSPSGSSISATYTFTPAANSTCTATFTAASTPPPSGGSAPSTPIQTSSISPAPSVCTTGKVLLINGKFDIPVTAISINGVSMATGTWSQTATIIGLTMPNGLTGNATIQLYNGAAPLLTAIVCNTAAPTVVAAPTPTPTPAPTHTPAPRPTATPVAKPAVHHYMKEFTVYFGMDGVDLDAKATETIKKMYDAIAPRLEGAHYIKAKITGWVQPTAISPHVQYLSVNRSKAVQAYLKELGLSAKYTIITPGETNSNISTSRKTTVVLTWQKFV